MTRNIYLKTVSPKDAVKRVQEALDRKSLIQEEVIPSHLALNRVLSRPVHAELSSPTYHSAAMDGYAVEAKATFEAREGFPVVLSKEQAIAINTGQALPRHCDAVIMIEHVLESPEGIAIEAPAFPWQHVRRMGEDVVATELLFARYHKIAPWDIGALLTAGVWEVPVWQQINACIIPTGDEVLDFAHKPNPKAGQVVESNSQMLMGLFTNAGCMATRTKPVPDDIASLHLALQKALDSTAQVILLCAGSSAGSKDFTRQIIEMEGEVLVHGIAVMPGKPSILGICRNKLVIGVPGYPVSALVCFEELIYPLMSWLNYRFVPKKPTIPVTLARALPSRPGMEEHVRLCVGHVGDTMIGVPLQRGAGNITSVTKAQAMARIPAFSEGLDEGDTVTAELMVHEDELDSCIVCVGSHDNTLDLITDELMARFGMPFISAHVGSMGGITALTKGTCHLAGMHLFEPLHNDFNFPFLLRFAPNLDVVVYNLAIRHQGLIVPKGNPEKVQGISDLTRVRFINRQRGSGTRILLDHHLQQAGIAPDSVQGYAKEEVTHMAVAVNVLTGIADCGMGIYAAAKALDLDFVPLAHERYDLVIPKAYVEDARIKAIISLLHDDKFKERIVAQGGAEITYTGQIMKAGSVSSS